MYKIVLKDNTVFNLKSIDEDTEKCLSIVLDTDLSHDAAISNFTKDNLQYVQVMTNDKVLNTYVTVNSVAESSVKNDVITIKLNKSDTKEIVVNLRKENEILKISNDKLILDMKVTNESVDEIRDMIIALSMPQ